ncbi:MAG: tetratricopeptide repeat protein [Bradyrhizobium sp.]|uniref:tetratricopeptide repeat protein n=1 Tax=Bradyrhizobium sp. TaxID=376 RepID=UPI0012004866|nr:tetratricopeptide repeat protein [Bradyrhizobium sp.]THD61736.1 MAG: tetratricopeptide repeat protein [Bradyrhizobium sp.]
MTTRRTVLVSVLLATTGFHVIPALAADAADTEVHRLQSTWEAIKFSVPEGDEQTRQMNALGEDADAVAAKFPDRPEILIWDGIITSERASMASAFSALGLAKRARDILEQAYKMAPAKLDAGATTSLGVLYYRVPGFPIGFGDKAKARQLLEQAVKLAPAGLDAWYFYGDFLYEQKEYPRAAEVFRHALGLPPHPDRPVWDKNRRLVIEERLASIAAKQ